MEIINCFIAFIIGVFFTLIVFFISAIIEDKKPKNKVRFYVARDKNGDLYLYLGKPTRCSCNFVNLYGSLGTFASKYDFKDFGLNPDDFDGLKWEDEPVEVFLNLKD